MARRKLIVLAVLCFGLIFVSCAKKPAASKSGAAKAEDVLSLLPKESRGVIVVDLHRLMQMGAVNKAIQEDKSGDYQKFVQSTGIDPQKDVFFAVAAMTGEIGQSAQDGAAIINLKYDKEKLLAMLKEEKGEPTQVEYDGFTIYQTVDKEDGKPMSGVFLDDANIAFGSEPAVKQVIDVFQKKADNLWKSADLAPLIKGTNTASMVWGAFSVPQQTVEKAASQNPMLGAFSEIKSLVLAFDSKDNNLSLEIKALSPNPDKNKQMAETLIGFKSLGGSAVSAKEPLLGEVLNKIEITSGADYVKITAVIPEDLLQSLSQKVKVQKSEEEN